MVFMMAGSALFSFSVGVLWLVLVYLGVMDDWFD
jgi:hypothetical protein